MTERHHFSYENHTSGRYKKVFLLEEDGDISENFQFKDTNRDDKIGGMDLIKVQFQMIVGKEIRKDCSCDSECIINIMPKVSVAKQQRIFFVINN